MFARLGNGPSNYTTASSNGTAGDNYIIPSFSKTSASSAPTYMLTENTSTGKWEVSLTDSNGVLSKYDFSTTSSISGITLTTSGNTLKISCTEEAARAIEAAGGITYSSNAVIYSSLLYRNGSDSQSFVTIVEEDSSSIKAYFKIDAEDVPEEETEPPTTTAPDDEEITIKIVKTDADTGAKLTGAKFKIEKKNGSSYTTIKSSVTITSSSGYTLSGLEPGTYRVTEIEAPEDYELADPAYQEKSCTTDGTTYTFTFANEPIIPETTAPPDDTEDKGYIKVTKQSSADNSKLGGASFKAVNNSTGETFYIGPTSSSTGTATSEALPLGTYTVTETTAPSGYKLNTTSQTVTVTANNTSTVSAASVTFKNDPEVGYIKVLKKDATDRTTNLQGAVFEIYNSSGTKVDTLTTGSNGTDTSVALPVGTYTVKETKAPTNYDIPSTAQWTVKVEASHTSSAPYTLTVYNTKQTGYIQVLKKDATDRTTNLSGAVFEIYNSSGTKVDTLTTGTSGTDLSIALTVGTYTVKETKAPTNYNIPSTAQWSVTVTASHTATVPYVLTVYNQIKTGYIQVFKKDATDQTTPLSGAVFEIYNSSGTKVDTLTTGTNGKDKSIELPVGTYTVKETSAPANYNLSNPSEWSVTVTENHTSTTPYELTVYNKHKMGYLQIVKRCLYDTSKGLQGAVFEVYNSGGTKVATLTSGTNGTIKSGELPIGTYTVKEVTPPTDYELSVPSQWTVKIEESHTSAKPYELTVYNEPSPGVGKIRKTVNAGESGGWKFKIYTNQACTTEYDGVVYTTNTSGYVDVELKVGTYYVKEITTGVDDTYWTFDTNVYTAVIKSNQVTDIGPFNNIYNGRIKIIKEMATDGDARGWVFEVTDSNGDPVEGSPFTTGADGTITTGKLFPGTYTVKEVIADDSPYYCKSENPQTLTVTAGQTASVTFTNALKPGDIQISKADGENDTPIAGVKFQLEWSEDGRTWSPVTYSSSADVVKGGCNSASLRDGCLITTANGIAHFTNLYPLLQYRIIEVETNDGMTLLPEPIVIESLYVEDDYKAVVTVYNDGTYELPHTGSNDISITVTVGSVAIAGAIAVLTFLFLNKKKKAAKA